MGGSQPTPKEKAQSGVRLLEEAIIDFLRQRGDWTRHSVIREALDISFPNAEGKQMGWFSGAILSKLFSDGRVLQKGGGKQPLLFKLPGPTSQT